MSDFEELRAAKTNHPIKMGAAGELFKHLKLDDLDCNRRKYGVKIFNPTCWRYFHPKVEANSNTQQSPVRNG